MKKIGIIGTGKLGSAILKNLLNYNDLGTYELYAYNRSTQKVDMLLKEYSELNKVDSISEISSICDILFLTVTYDQIEKVLKEIKNHIDQNTIIISCEARTSIDKINKVVGEDIFVYRIMTNTTIETHNGVIAYCFNDSKKINENNEYALQILNALAPCVKIQEDLMSTYTAVVGSISSFLYMFLEASVDALVLNGVNVDEAYSLLIKTLLGTFNNLENSDKDFKEVKHELYYPQGITINGICQLEKHNFRYSIIDAFNTMVNTK